MKTITIPVKTYTIDHQDGGGSTTIYPDLETLQKDRWDWEGEYADFDTKEESDAHLQDVLDEVDPYENGEIHDSTITLIVEDDGTIKLGKAIFTSWGQ